MLAQESVERLLIDGGWYCEEVRALPGDSGLALSCPVMQRLGGLGLPVVVLAQYGRGGWNARRDYRAKALGDIGTVLGCARDAGLVAFVLAEPWKAAVEACGLDAFFLSEHHTPEGNRVVAEPVQQELVSR